MKIPVGVQLYSIRQDCEADLLGSIAKVAEMGYQGVEFAGYFGHSAETLKATLDAAGITAPSTHIGLGNFDADKFDATIEFHKILGVRNLIIPGLPMEMHDTAEHTLETSKLLSDLTAKVREHGFRLGFHAHGTDMVVIEGGKSSYTILGENTPDDFVMQYDTANGMSAGADPVQPILEFPGRGLSTHLKEWSGEHGAKVIGEGMIPWMDVFHACETVAGTEWYIVEHESYEGMSPLEAIRLCLVNIREMGR